MAVEEHLLISQFTPYHWVKIQHYLNKDGLQQSVNLSRLRPDIVNEEWFDNFVKLVMGRKRHPIRTCVPRGPLDQENSMKRNIMYWRLRRKHVVSDLTTATLVMRLKENQLGLETFFFKDPLTISEDIRRNGLGELLGTYATRRLISKLFEKLQDGDCLQKSTTAANLLVSVMKSSVKARHLPANQLSGRSFIYTTFWRT